VSIHAAKEGRAVCQTRLDKSIEVIRQWETREADRRKVVKDAHQALSALRPSLGLRLEAQRGDGVLVKGAKRGCSGHRCGLRAGDVIMRVGETVIKDVPILKAIFAKVYLGQSIPVLIKRQTYMAINLTVGAKGLAMKLCTFYSLNFPLIFTHPPLTPSCTITTTTTTTITTISTIAVNTLIRTVEAVDPEWRRHVPQAEGEEVDDLQY
jgi:hypothetical protein